MEINNKTTSYQTNEIERIPETSENASTNEASAQHVKEEACKSFNFETQKDSNNSEILTKRLKDEEGEDGEIIATTDIEESTDKFVKSGKSHIKAPEVLQSIDDVGCVDDDYDVTIKHSPMNEQHSNNHDVDEVTTDTGTDQLPAPLMLQSIVSSAPARERFLHTKSGASSKLERTKLCPILLRCAFSTKGRRNNPQALLRRPIGANQFCMNTWKDARLREIAAELRNHCVEARKSGALLRFFRVYPERGSPNVFRRFLGSITNPSLASAEATKGQQNSSGGAVKHEDNSELSLMDTNFRIGDLIDVCVSLPNSGSNNNGGIREMPPPRRT